MDNYLFDSNIIYLEYLYNLYKKNKDFSFYWRNYFNSFNKSNINCKVIENININKNLFIKKNLLKLIYNIRKNGFKFSKINPIKKKNIKIDLKNYDLENYINEVINIDTFKNTDIKKIFILLKNTYCKSIGIEIDHINNKKEFYWFIQKLEKKKFFFSNNKKKKIFKYLLYANLFEKYLNNIYLGQKRFSLEGCESLIPLLKQIISSSVKKNIKKILIGMSHRGRLNVLINILKKLPYDLFSEFNDINKSYYKNKDVKYHRGYHNILKIKNKEIDLYLANNPSHLEYVNSVVLGMSYAKISNMILEDKDKVLTLIIHGDTSVTGQGINMENLNFSKCKNYSVLGTIHIIINNQIGFTSNFKEVRSSKYCTDVFKFLKIPIFHVNVNDPEALIFVAKIAIKYRMKFKKDFIINLFCFRKLGHNEQDTPNITNPFMYNVISKYPEIHKIYFNKIKKQNIISKNYSIKVIKNYLKYLKNSKSKNKINLDNFNKQEIIYDRQNISSIDTTVSIKKIKLLINNIKKNIPNNFIIHPLVEKIINDRTSIRNYLSIIDWGTAEYLSYASILNEGYNIRISGQDCIRGTFSNRHAIVFNQKISKKNSIYIPLKNLSKKQGNFEIVNSPLSEESILGFEYGYSIIKKNDLNIWEAQFGDFVNGAQVIIDQFLVSGKDKWDQHSNLVLMLPHGFEGQGPEHSSGRIERFLDLTANNNIQIIQPSIPSQLFHVIRRQILGNFNKPLIIFTPKSLLRSNYSVSYLSEISDNNFKKIILDIQKNISLDLITRLLICTGKIYFELNFNIKKYNIKNIGIIRIEQLYPLDFNELINIIIKFKNIKEFIWVQEEPKNQGAWLYIKEYLLKINKINKILKCISRKKNSFISTGNYNEYLNEQSSIIKNAIF